MMTIFTTVVVVAGVLAVTGEGVVTPCTGEVSKLPFCDTSLSASRRAADLVERLTVDEKLTQLGNSAPSIPRLSVPNFEYHSEGLHGLRTVCNDIPELRATLFPQVTTMAATGNLTLILAMAQTMATEGRAVNNYANGTTFPKGAGLSYWGPTINIGRDPRWGRFQESVSECPWLNGAYAARFVAGMQGEGDGVPYLKLAATCKHFYAYSLENADGFTRHNFNAIVSRRDLAETYMVPFKACLEAKVAQVMCSYNAVNGIPTCLDSTAIGGLRREGGFSGVVVSDCDAIGDAYKNHKYVKDAAEATAGGVKAGCDMDCGKTYNNGAKEAVAKGLLNETDLDNAMVNIFRMRMELGTFDPPSMVPYRTIGSEHLDSPAARALSEQAATEGIVLLKNDGGLLPLDPSRKVVVMGSQANATAALSGAKSDYCPSFYITAFQGLAARGEHVALSPSMVPSEGAAEARKADAAVVVVGGLLGSEGGDRDNITIPDADMALLLAVSKAQPNTVCVIITGEPVAIDRVAQEVRGVVLAGEGGQAAGKALAAVLFGDESPSGVLPFTIYPDQYISQLAMSNMSMRAGPGRTYRFFKGTATFPFGFGLSYTSFGMRFAEVPHANQSLETLRTTPLSYVIDVTSQSPKPVQKVVQAYIAMPDHPDAPIRSLFAMTKIHVIRGVGQAHLTTMQIPGLCTFCSVDDDGVVAVRPGRYVITVGDSQTAQLTHEIYAS
eukprot:Sspe_Gene.57144::Locus_31375_Transcript_1_1_Confidence_1.000_Length_2333::g.57144::m.57144